MLFAFLQLIFRKKHAEPTAREEQRSIAALVREIVFDIVSASSTGVRRTSEIIMDRMQTERYRPFPLNKHLSMILCDAGRKMPSMATLRTLAHSRWHRCGMQAAIVSDFRGRCNQPHHIPPQNTLDLMLWWLLVRQTPNSG